MTVEELVRLALPLASGKALSKVQVFSLIQYTAFTRGFFDETTIRLATDRLKAVMPPAKPGKPGG